MSAIPYVGKCFSTVEDFLAYLDAIRFGAWRPSYVVAHHTGGPDLKTWRGWQTRAVPVTDEQWLKNLAEYYGSPPPRGPGDGPWQHGPHFMFTPKSYGVLSLPTVRGTHAKSFNANSWSVEMVGDFDSEPFDGDVRDRYVAGLAALHVAAGLHLEPFEKRVRGLHFHRDDPLTSKTCPGKHVEKPALVDLVQAQIDKMTGVDREHQPDVTVPVPAEADAAHASRSGVVTIDNLTVRAGAGVKNPPVRSLRKGDRVQILGEADNAGTKWANIAPGEWVAARFVSGA